MTEETLFAQALQRSDPTERAAFLDQACAGDAAVRARVEDLLKAHAAAGSFLEGPVPDPSGTSAFAQAVGTSPASAPAESAGMHIGPYKLLQKLGEGGMGAVWLAEQSVPVQRRVALKLIKAGMDSAHVLARFEAERQALALMDHPHIARVFDAGASDGGRPYFVMELVKGVPITRFCDQERLSPRERLELFIPVCQAVQHAHQKGIIHRDLKPSNVLIALYDGKPVPKVIDFGVAKATSQKLTAHSLFTEIGQVVGTLEYMAPEQAELNNLDIDTRADIYSLGVLLYELLTGSPPFTSKQLRSAAFTEMLRIIREVEPPKPSTRLSFSEELPTIAAKRKLEPKRLTRLVHGDLDWIVMKCLEKERSRRYETANGLALEIQRYLADEPVLAGPPSAAYRLRKFVRRHKGPVLAAAVALLALVGGVVGTTLGLVQADQARQAEEVQHQNALTREQEALQAAVAERLAKEAAQRAQDAERSAKELAQTRLKQIEKANDILANIFHDLDPRAEEKGGPPLRTQLSERLEQAAGALDGEAVGDRLTMAQLQIHLGLTLGALGHPRRELELLSKAWHAYEEEVGPKHPYTLTSKNHLAGAYLHVGQPGEAIQRFEEVLSARKATLGPNHPETLRTVNDLAAAYVRAGRPGEAIPLLERALPAMKATLGADHVETLGSMSTLAAAYQTAGRHAEAISLYEAILPAEKARLGPDHFHTLTDMNNLALAYKNSRRLAEAIELYEKVLPARKAKLGPDHPETIKSMHNLAAAYKAAGRPVEAIKLREQVLSFWMTRLGPDHPDTIDSMGNLAAAYLAAEQPDKALPLFNDFMAAQRKRLGADHPGFAFGLAAVGQNLLHHHQYAAAERLLRECLAIRQKHEPDAWTTFNTQSLLGGALTGQQQYAAAEPLLLQAYQGMQERAGKVPAQARVRLAEALERLVRLYEEWGKPEEAAKWHKELETRQPPKEKQL